MKTALRILIIALCALILGVILNQGNDQGIHWRTLLEANPFVTQSETEVFVPADKAYLYLMEDGAVFFDVRPFEEYAMDHIPGALPLNATTLLSNPEIIHTANSDRMVIVYGFQDDSEDARIFAQIVRRYGHPKTMLLEGGFAAWLDKGLPVQEGRMP
jgi:3-mercaptopyruvate sulfurtransferase SseA